MKAEQDAEAMRQERDAIETALAAHVEADEERPVVRLDGLVVLYVGGRPNQIVSDAGGSRTVRRAVAAS